MRRTESQVESSKYIRKHCEKELRNQIKMEIVRTVSREKGRFPKKLDEYVEGTSQNRFGNRLRPLSTLSDSVRHDRSKENSNSDSINIAK